MTGNLGLYKKLPLENTYYHTRWKTSEEGKVKNGESISIIDASSEEVVETLPVGRRPTSIDISSNYIASGNFSDNTVHIFERKNLNTCLCVAKINPFPNIEFDLKLKDERSGANLKVPLSLRSIMVEGISILEKRKWILVAGFEGSVLTVIDLTLGNIIAIVPVQAGPMDVVVNLDETLAFATCYQAGEVSVVNLDTCTEIYRLGVGREPMDPGIFNDMLIVPHGKGATIHNIKNFKDNLKFQK
ncbi:MAG: hypothetical protein CFH06_01879 [Alphaproteobacteria bacterium MarineAlpha3_Bin5]|nr:MAG: hypothetical protein CFH06_01879 [Alphaproteobacteria bacterium MarineAlpha3_Bin5]